MTVRIRLNSREETAAVPDKYCMGAELTIESELDLAWKIHGDDHRQATAARDHFRSQIKRRLGPETASKIQFHVDAAMRRFLDPDLPKPRMKRREFDELLALEMAVQEIEARIEAGNTFYDPYHVNGLLPTLGMSWSEDVAPLLDGQENPSYMRPENVVRFLSMVLNADQRLPSGEESEERAEQLRRDRLELIRFLERAIGLREAVWCSL